MKQCFTLLSFALASLLLLSSCGTFRKMIEKHQEKIDSISTKQVDSTAYHFKDSVSKKETVVSDENTVTIEFDTINDTINDTISDTIKIPINGNDYFYVPVKGKVKKLTYHSIKTDLHKDSTHVKQGDSVRINETNETKVHREEKQTTKVKSKTMIPLPVWLLFLLAALAVMYWRRKQLIKFFIGLV